MPRSDERIGYRRPPSATRFQPGRSGNPKGRPKRTPSFIEDVIDELNRPHRLNTRETVTRQRAIAIALVAKAIEGDTRAVGVLMRFMTNVEEREEQPQRELSAAQQALLRELVADEILTQKTAEADDDAKITEDQSSRRDTNQAVD